MNNGLVILPEIVFPSNCNPNRIVEILKGECTEESSRHSIGVINSSFELIIESEEHEISNPKTCMSNT